MRNIKWWLHCIRIMYLYGYHTETFSFQDITFTDMRFYRKVPGLGRKRNAGLTYSILAAISFKISLLGKVYSDPIVFSILQ
jgi:hypothetical protein